MSSGEVTVNGRHDNLKGVKTFDTMRSLPLKRLRCDQRVWCDADSQNRYAINIFYPFSSKITIILSTLVKSN